MRVAYLECFSGISGDMFSGALLDAGVPFALLEGTVAALNIGATLETSKVTRGGITATKFDVIVEGERDMPRAEFWAKKHHKSLPHNHATHGVEPAAKVAHDDGPIGHSHPHQRSLRDILDIIASAPISSKARQTASDIFRALGSAEAKIHNTDLEHVHFHEVGAVDAIVDIVCAAVGAEALGVDAFYSSALNVGSGTIICAHGVLPVPAPATLELLKDSPIYSGDIQKELVTPTGAAIVKVLVSRFATRPMMKTESIGYGSGTRDFPGHANVLRLTVGETLESQVAHEAEALRPAAEEEVSILEANIDDLNPQLIGYIVDLALAKGALDVFTTPVQMKKNRPGTLLTVLARPQDEQVLRTLLFRESSTLGIRSRRERRYVLARRHVSLETPWGEVRMKIGSLNGTVSQFAPEYEDCRRLAAEHNVPLKTVMQEAVRLYLDQKHE